MSASLTVYLRLDTSDTDNQSKKKASIGILRAHLLDTDVSFEWPKALQRTGLRPPTHFLMLVGERGSDETHCLAKCAVRYMLIKLP